MAETPQTPRTPKTRARKVVAPVAKPGEESWRDPRTELTDELIVAICKDVRLGATDRLACQRHRVDPRTFRRWMQAGRHLLNPEEVPAPDTKRCAKPSAIHVRLVRAYQEAEAQAAAWALSNWQQQMPSDWRASAEFMRRRFPDEYGDRVEVSGSLRVEMTVVEEVVGRFISLAVDCSREDARELLREQGREILSALPTVEV